ncbi:hypothetical protein KFF05_17350 [bacterium SCSIO 12827]|nr:hypothetical protein KFF05_17350 [bacterium SCSIO 12827]
MAAKLPNGANVRSASAVVALTAIQPALHQRWIAPLLAMVLLGALAFGLGWHQLVPILSKWEAFQYFYNYATVDPHLSFAIAPRANIGGQGYPLLDMGRFATDLFGLSLPTFRTASLLYGLAAYGLIIVVFRRWFGLYAALAGTTLTVLSIGYLFMSNQMLVFTPTSLLCVLLVERTQTLGRKPNCLIAQSTVVFVLAMLLIHYAMGRYFAVGWIAWFFLSRIAVAQRVFGLGAAWREFVSCQFRLAFGITIATATLLCLLDPRNAAYLIDPVSIFFPDQWDEVETSPGKLLPTVLGNIALLGEMIFPFLTQAAPNLPDPLLTGARAPILNYWHTPFLILGFCVAVVRTGRRTVADVLPYASIHVIAFLTLGLTLFSEQIGDLATISANRTFCGFFAFAGYIVVAFKWIAEKAQNQSALLRFGLLALPYIFCAAAVPVLNVTFRGMSERISAMATIDDVKRQFSPVPTVLPAGIQADTYLHARYARLAERLMPWQACFARHEVVLLRVSPQILLNRGKYDGLHYIHNFNDLSSTFALYLSNLGMNVGHVVVHGIRAKGYKDRGHGYGGRPRVFSGPIAWRDEEIIYPARGPRAFQLVASHQGRIPDFIVTFSQAEADAARQLLADLGRRTSEPVPITSLPASFIRADGASTPCQAIR